MGGAIGMTYLEQHPNDFNAAAFSSPMLGLKPGTCTVVSIMGGEEPKYGPGQSGYNNDQIAFEENVLTGSEARYERMNAAFDQVPEAKLGGATYQWVHSSCQQFSYIFGHIRNIRTPFILFSAQNEQIVNPRAHQKFVEKALELGKECKAYQVNNTQHELLMEKDKQRTEVINAAIGFFVDY
jgi:lysophospholipase